MLAQLVSKVGDESFLILLDLENVSGEISCADRADGDDAIRVDDLVALEISVVFDTR